MNDIYLRERHLKMLHDIFKVVCPNSIILAYGSRIKNDAHSGSDLDLTISNFSDYPFNIKKLHDQLDESNIPFFVEISILEKLPSYFQTEINKLNIEIFPNFTGNHLI